MGSHGYNGWANYPTWCVALWIDNEEHLYRAWRDVATDCWDELRPEATFVEKKHEAIYELATRLKDHFEMSQEDLELTGWWSDLMSFSLGLVEWSEVAKAILEGAEPWES